MKILAFSDLHRNFAAARTIVAASDQADVLVGAGDFATCGQGAWDVLQILQTADLPMILVPGNHDDMINLEQICQTWQNGHLLHGTRIELAGVNFFGLGCEIPNRCVTDWNFSINEERAAKLMSECPPNTVLVTHTPPYGTADLQHDGAHEGSRAIADTISEKQPMLSLCGHIHHSWGTDGMIGQTPVYNLGPQAQFFTVP